MRPYLVGILVMCSVFFTGCFGNTAEDKQASEVKIEKEMLVYSELDQAFTEDLLNTFNKKIAAEAKESDQGKLYALKAVYQLDESKNKPDIVLGRRVLLQQLTKDKKLQPVGCRLGDVIPEKLKDKEHYWYGCFYDPTVLLVNQQFSRKLGQKNLKSWQDLEDNEGIRIAMENLSNSEGTRDFLGAFADKLGETASLNYLWFIGRKVGQYGRFPFSSVRVAAVGDADVAITRQSYVFKYLDNKFPAYVVLPKEGTPVNLYGVGVYKDCDSLQESTEFLEWMLAADESQRISQEHDTGMMFILPRGDEGAVVDPELLWLNNSYTSAAKSEELSSKWLQRVRFSK